MGLDTVYAIGARIRSVTQSNEPPVTMRGDRAAARAPFPARRVYAWIAALVAAFAIYASLIPFEFRSVPLDAAVDRFERIMLSTRAERTSRSNYLANGLLFVPIGFGLSGALLLDSRRRSAALLAVPAVLSASLAVSLTAEFLQIFTPWRVVSRNDVVAQTLGCAAGMAAWALAGKPLTRWLRHASDRQRGDRVAHALGAYAVLWIFVKLAPFDLTVDLGTIANRYRQGLISLVPFAGTDVPASRLLRDAVSATLSAAPLGALGLVGWTGVGARRHSRAAFAFGALFVVLVEAAQIFIRSHTADMTDVLFGLLGVAGGVWLGRRAFLHRQAIAALPPRAVSVRALLVLLLWGALMAAYHWQPYDFTFDAELIKAKLDRMSLVPFSGYWSGSELNTFRNVLVKLAVSIPFGIIASYAMDVWRASRAVAIAAWIVLAAGVFAVLEAGQLLLPSRTADPTDVFISVAGAATGLWIGRWLRS